MSGKKPQDKKLDLGLKKGTQSKDFLKLQKAISTHIETMPLIYEMNMIQAKNKKHQFDEYIKAGFTAEQALELIK